MLLVLVDEPLLKGGVGDGFEFPVLKEGLDHDAEDVIGVITLVWLVMEEKNVLNIAEQFYEITMLGGP